MTLNVCNQSYVPCHVDDVNKRECDDAMNKRKHEKISSACVPGQGSKSRLSRVAAKKI
jgi:hypothetical protein